MRKKIYGKQLSRGRNARKALFRSLIRAMVLSGKINTTKAKAKAVQPDIDKLMNIVASGSLAAKRAVLAKVANDKELSKKLFQDYGELAKLRKSGFTKIILLPRRKGDNAELARMEWTTMPEPAVSVKSKKTKTKIKTKK